MTYAYERDPASIYAQSFAIVRGEARLGHLPPEAHDVAVRVAHACGMPDVTDDLVVSPGAVEAAREALAGGAPVLVDAMMVAHGVIRQRLPARNEVICTLNDPRTAPLAAERGTTRSAAQVALWSGRLGGAVVAIGNAPTALFRLLELVEDGAPRPALVVGMAVGFVGAAESKEALVASGLPHIVVRGRRGGSAMAAAVVNALGNDVTSPGMGAADGPTVPDDAERVLNGPGAGLDAGAAGIDPSPTGSAAASAESGNDDGPHPVTILGTDASGAIDPAGRAELERADIVFGPARLIEARAPDRGPERRAWGTPFRDGLTELRRRREAGERVAVLASGDPMQFGVGGTLAREFGSEAVRGHPAPSAFSLAAARLGWPLEDVGTLSLHGGEAMGRGVATLAQHVAPGRRLLALTSDGDTPGEVAAWLTARGLGTSTLTVLERMGAADERVRRARADTFDLAGIDPLNTLAVACEAAPGAAWHALAPGLPDEAFVHDGQITKCEVRAPTVARLRPYPGARLWDIGAGCGSVGLEWLRLSPGGAVVAFEPREDRRAMVAQNYARFGLRASIVAGRFDPPTGGPAPDAVFVGGGLSHGAAEAAWPRLRAGGTMVANAVTLEGEAILAALHVQHGGALTRIAVQRAEPVGPFRGWRAAMPVTIWSVVKGTT